MNTLRKIFPTLFVLCLLAGCSPAKKATLSFEAPQGWLVDYKDTDGIQLYKITPGNPDLGLLTIAPSTAVGKSEQIPALLQQRADHFLAMSKASPQRKLAKDNYETNQFTGKNCHGNYATFQFINTNGSKTNLQVLFFMAVHGKLWNGQFTGAPEAWNPALNLLTSIK